MLVVVFVSSSHRGSHFVSVYCSLARLSPTQFHYEPAGNLVVIQIQKYRITNTKKLKYKYKNIEIQIQKYTNILFFSGLPTVLATWLKSSIKDKIQWSRIIEKCSHIAALMKSRRGIAVIEGYYYLRKGTESPVKLNSAETCTKILFSMHFH